jgi:hypothetical protein
VEGKRRKRKKETVVDAKLSRILAHTMSHLVWGTDIFQMQPGKATFDGWMTTMRRPNNAEVVHPLVACCCAYANNFF